VNNACGKRSQAANIRAVVAHLESLGLSVYGSYIDFENGIVGPGCMDYDADMILKYRRLREKNPGKLRNFDPETDL